MYYTTLIIQDYLNNLIIYLCLFDYLNTAQHCSTEHSSFMLKDVTLIPTLLLTAWRVLGVTDDLHMYCISKCGLHSILIESIRSNF